MKDRIEKIIRDEGISSSRFADELGIQRSSISHILSGRNKPSLDVFQRILRKYPNINSDWLILGIGNMYKDVKTVEQKDIFSEIEENRKQEVKTSVENKETPLKTEISDFDTAKSAKEIEKIIIFYSDKTFDIYK